MKIGYIALFLLLGCLPLRAQWSGNAELAAGLGAMEGNEANDGIPMFHAMALGKVHLDYKTEKFDWGLSVDGKWEPKTTANARLSYKDGKLNLVYKAAYTRPINAGLRSDFHWRPTPQRKYDAWLQYKYKNDRADNHTLNFDGELEELEKFSYYYEVPALDEHKVEAGLKTATQFNGGRDVLLGSLKFQAVGSRRANTWTVFKTDPDDGGGGTAIKDQDLEGYAWKYRITPNSLDLNTDGDIRLELTGLDGPVSLKYAPGARLSLKHALDHNRGATSLISSTVMEGEWRDSTRLREDFNFLTLRVEPYLTADFQWRSIEAHADYACQVYSRRLNDDTHVQPLRIKGIYPVGKGNVTWAISPAHTLKLKNEMSVSHPEYVKICWYDRTAGYMDQLYRGNEQLRSPQTRLYELEHIFSYKRFSAKTGVSYKRVLDEVEQTWSYEEIEGRQYKVFHWLNAADSRSLGLSEKLSWSGKIITANAAITYNRSRRVAKAGGAVKNTFDWKLTGDILAKLGRGWSVGADATYRSKVATFFTMFKEYCVLNAKVQKEFKHVTLYLEGKDLLDQERETSFENQDTQEAWIEKVRQNRRLVILGVKWNF